MAELRFSLLLGGQPAPAFAPLRKRQGTGALQERKRPAVRKRIKYFVTRFRQSASAEQAPVLQRSNTPTLQYSNTPPLQHSGREMKMKKERKRSTSSHAARWMAGLS